MTLEEAYDPSLLVVSHSRSISSSSGLERQSTSSGAGKTDGSAMPDGLLQWARGRARGSFYHETPAATNGQPSRIRGPVDCTARRREEPTPLPGKGAVLTATVGRANGNLLHAERNRAARVPCPRLFAGMYPLGHIPDPSGRQITQA